MDHQLLLASMSFGSCVELRLDYGLFIFCLMSQLDRTEAFCPAHRNKTRAPSQTVAPQVIVSPVSAQWFWCHLCVSLCMSIGDWRAYLFSPRCPLTRFPSNVSETLLSLARRLFHRELLNHVNLLSPEFQMQAVEKISHCFRMTSGIY